MVAVEQHADVLLSSRRRDRRREVEHLRQGVDELVLHPVPQRLRPDELEAEADAVVGHQLRHRRQAFDVELEVRRVLEVVAAGPGPRHPAVAAEAARDRQPGSQLLYPLLVERLILGVVPGRAEAAELQAGRGHRLLYLLQGEGFPALADAAQRQIYPLVPVAGRQRDQVSQGQVDTDCVGLQVDVHVRFLSILTGVCYLGRAGLLRLRIRASSGRAAAPSRKSAAFPLPRRLGAMAPVLLGRKPSGPGASAFRTGPRRPPAATRSRP